MDIYQLLFEYQKYVAMDTFSYVRILHARGIGIVATTVPVHHVRHHNLMQFRIHRISAQIMSSILTHDQLIDDHNNNNDIMVNHTFAIQSNTAKPVHYQRPFLNFKPKNLCQCVWTILRIPTRQQTSFSFWPIGICFDGYEQIRMLIKDIESCCRSCCRWCMYVSLKVDGRMIL